MYAMNRTATIVERIASSDIYKDYERAFSEATKLPLALRPVETWRFALENKKYENPFCAMLAKCNRTCAACLETQKKMDDVCTSPDKTDTEIWLTNAVCYRSECCTAFKVASRHKRRLPTGYPPFIPFALLNYVTHSEKE